MGQPLRGRHLLLSRFSVVLPDQLVTRQHRLRLFRKVHHQIGKVAPAVCIAQGDAQRGAADRVG